MTRVLVHAGFHKTGTSSLQDYLLRHREALSPWLAYYGRQHFPELDRAAKSYGGKPFPWRLAAVRREAREFLAGVPEAELIVLSRESFCGIMPGRRDRLGRFVRGYAPRAVPLARVLIEEIRRRFGPEVKVEFLYTLREGEAWLRSVWGHLLRATPLKLDYDEFRARFPARVDLGAEARRIAEAIAPVPVHVAALEELAHMRAGPAKAVLDLAGVPGEVRRKLGPALIWNMGQKPEIEAQFLALNRAGLPRKELVARKEALGRRVRARQ